MLVYLAGKIGMRDAVKVATFIVQWGIVARRKGREPRPEEYSAYWGESIATYYRELSRFRKVWPEDKSPQVRWRWVEKNVRIPLKIDNPDRVVARLLVGPVPS